MRAGDEVELETAAGVVLSRWWQSVELTLLGRTGTYRALELPGTSEPLLGVVPLEDLGMSIDLRDHVLRVLPEQGPSSRLLAYSAGRKLQPGHSR